MQIATIKNAFFVPLTAVILMFAALPSSGLSNSSNEDRWRFQVFIDDRDVGTHNFLVSTDENAQAITSEANFNVRLLFVNVFSYKHTNNERWQANCLANIESATRMNKKQFAVSGRRQDSAFVVNTKADEQALPACVQTFAYWNPSILQASQLLNAQTGALEDVQISFAGEESFTLQGQPINADRYRITLKAGYIDVWYDSSTRTWLGLETLTPDGNLVRYIPLETPLSKA